MSETLIRSYQPSDSLAIQRIHEANALDFKFPNLNRGDFMVNKVLEVDGQTRASYALKLTAEAYMWLDRTSWTDAGGRWAAIKVLDGEASEAAKGLGIDSTLCCLPPGYERFGRRIKDLGFEKIRPDWAVYTKEL